MAGIGQSGGEFVTGLLRHFAYLVPGVVLGGLQVAERSTGGPVAVAPWLFWSVLAGGLFASALLTYHDLRKTLAQPTEDLRRALRGAEEDLLRYCTTLERAEARGLYAPGEGFPDDRWQHKHEPVVAGKLPDSAYVPIREAYRSAGDMNRGIEAKGRALGGDEAKFQQAVDNAIAAIRGELRKLEP